MTQFAFTRYTNRDKKFDAFGRPLVQTPWPVPRLANHDGPPL